MGTHLFHAIVSEVFHFQPTFRSRNHLEHFPTKSCCLFPLCYFNAFFCLVVFTYDGEAVGFWVQTAQGRRDGDGASRRVLPASQSWQRHGRTVRILQVAERERNTLPPSPSGRLSLKQKKLLNQPGQWPLKLTGPADFLLAWKKSKLQGALKCHWLSRASNILFSLAWNNFCWPLAGGPVLRFCLRSGCPCTFKQWLDWSFFVAIKDRSRTYFAQFLSKTKHRPAMQGASVCLLLWHRRSKRRMWRSLLKRSRTFDFIRSGKTNAWKIAGEKEEK